MKRCGTLGYILALTSFAFNREQNVETIPSFVLRVGPRCSYGPIPI